jgi:DNA-binding response OmpR family regulator
MSILIIDDDEEYCTELSYVIKAEGFQVKIANNGVSGLELAESGGYSLIILDLKLPEMDGYEVLQRIRRGKTTVKVLILSGRPLGETLLERENLSKEEEDRILSLADAIMSKPFKIDEFLEKINTLARK